MRYVIHWYYDHWELYIDNEYFGDFPTREEARQQAEILGATPRITIVDVDDSDAPF